MFNNAGTGHEANSELNYTPDDEEKILNFSSNRLPPTR